MSFFVNFFGGFLGSFIGFFTSICLDNFISSKKLEKDFKDRWLE